MVRTMRDVEFSQTVLAVRTFIFMRMKQMSIIVVVVAPLMLRTTTSTMCSDKSTQTLVVRMVTRAQLLCTVVMIKHSLVLMVDRMLV